VKAFVIGQPISHSLSPTIFRMIAEIEQSSLNYSAAEVTPEKLSSFFEDLREDDDFVGANVTIPHKEAALILVDEASAEAKVVGAVNVILAGPRKLKGYNTDVVGIRKTLEIQNFKAGEKTALVLGAGGSARAVAYVLAEAGAKIIFIYNPRSARGDALCESLQKYFSGTRFHSVRDLKSVSDLIDLVVNCTPIGMKGEVSDFFEPLLSLAYAPHALAFDLLYTPTDLLFLRTMRKQGLACVDGLNMLIEQALATWELWIGKLHHADELRVKITASLSAILSARENPNPIFLTGFMGVGKSTIARELSYALNRRCYDTDRLIEETAKATVSEIFAKDGETHFRALEMDAIQKATKLEHSVIALGGGALNHAPSLEAVLNGGTLVYLKANESTLYRRLKKRAHLRPLLANLDDAQMKQKISDMLKLRTPIYERAPVQVEIKADDTPYDTAQTVVSALGRRR
jgi:shikimate dehydrogenase